MLARASGVAMCAALVLCSSALGRTASEEGSHCRWHHSGRFCQVREQRHAIHLLRSLEAAQARRAKVSFRRHALRSWRVGVLRRVNRWERRTLAHLRSVPTPVSRPRVSASPLYADFLCIHSHEGAWNANTGNGYFGGLQADMEFQRSYGAQYLARWGTADHWPPWAQLAMAYRAYASGRGFSPWPLTSRMCGL